MVLAVKPSLRRIAVALCLRFDVDISTGENVRHLLDDGVRIISGAGEEAARIGRAITGSVPPA
jgi:hypothetical protein